MTLKEADLVAPDFKNEQGFVSVPLRAVNDGPSVETGHLSSQDVDTLYKIFKSKHAFPPKNGGISVLVSLATLYDASASHGAYHSLLVLPAKLERNGTLHPDADNWPWINIERLHRTGIPDEELMIGNDDALKRFWTFVDRDGKALESQEQTWENRLKYARKMFKAVSGKELEKWVNEKNSELNESTSNDASETHSKVVVDSCYVIQQDRIIASGGIQKLYQYLEEERKLPPLYSHLLSADNHERPLGTAKLAKAWDVSFTGTMSDRFPLTDTQRIAVRGFFTDSEGDITAISGPPGTGKTTMLQAIVASTLVNHALEKADPPLIVGTSTNNQAVTNIIDSFASVGKDNPTIWEHRWIVKAPADYDDKDRHDVPLKSLAVYCPSGQKAKAARSKGYLIENHRLKNDTYALYSGSDYSQEALNRYLAFAAEAFDHRFRTASEVEDAVQEKLASINKSCEALVGAFAKRLNGKETNAKIRQEVSALASMRAFGATDEQVEANKERFDELLDSAYLDSYEKAMNELDKLLDITVRYAQFWLAVHYYEAQWVGHEEDNSYVPQSKLQKNTPIDMDEYWRQATALTPCYVMTEYQIPQWMKLYTKEKGEHYDTGRIDLLIVDEAGQVDTCVGAAAFALAKRAIVVGDENQLSPVWGIEPETDKYKASGFGIGDDGWRVLESHGLTCSKPSSIMRAASFASHWSYGPDKDGKMSPGLFLAEHFRCHPLIINFCNELLYGGMLKPRRPMPTPIIQQLKQRALENSQLNGEPEQSATDNEIDDRGCYKAYRLFNVVDNPLLFVPVEGSKSQRAGSSRKNPVEAQTVASWIAENGSFFTDVYGKELGETIAVVTPFAAQARCISQELTKAIGFANAHNITVGTAHRLQGAERPIILFSCVYGDDDATAAFIDSTLELMNVAASRAKDLFIVFGSQTRWNDRGTTFHLIHKLATKSDGRFTSPGKKDSPPTSTVVNEKPVQEDGVSSEDSGERSRPSKAPSRPSVKDYLRVPFEEKEEAKKLGARWDREEQLWFAAANTDPAVYDRWGTYLNVPFGEKEEAKKLGARWDRNHRRWYAPPDRNLEDFERWR